MIVARYRGWPNEYNMVVSDGRVVKQGRAITCVVTRRSRVLAVPVGDLTASMSVSARSSDLQPVHLEGELTFRVTSPAKAASAFDFAVSPMTGEHTSDGPKQLRRAALQITRDILRDELSRMSVERMLGSEPVIGKAVLVRLGHSSRLRELGVRPLNVFVKDLVLRPDMTRAIEEKATVACISGLALAHGGSAAMSLKPPNRGTPEPEYEHSTGMECTDSCPFRDVCRDYQNEVRGGRAWCTLFREFST